VCERKRESERESERVRERESEREKGGLERQRNYLQKELTDNTIFRWKRVFAASKRGRERGQATGELKRRMGHGPGETKKGQN
jgi:hypothetical protein